MHRRRRTLFLRLAGAAMLMVALGLGGLMVLAFLFLRSDQEGGRLAGMVWLTGCSLALALPLLAGALAFAIYRRVATPLADVMAAADAVAEGDLSVRVPVPTRGPDDFGRLVESFNRMTEELARADQRRRNLTADVAHELRTPLHIIQGNLEGILDGVYQPTPEHMNATLEETRTLARLVEDLRTLSLAEAGQLPLVREPIDVAELLSDVSTSFSGQAEAVGIDLRVEVDHVQPPLSIRADPCRLDQALSNLVSNALRHTSAGGSVMLRGEAVAGGVHLLVSDTGEGIPPEDLPFIFDRFWRGDQSRTHTDGAGSGLGLAIAKQLVQAHGGRISVESTLHQGTTFLIDLQSEPQVLI